MLTDEPLQHSTAKCSPMFLQVRKGQNRNKIAQGSKDLSHELLLVKTPVAIRVSLEALTFGLELFFLHFMYPVNYDWTE